MDKWAAACAAPRLARLPGRTSWNSTISPISATAHIPAVTKNAARMPKWRRHVAAGRRPDRRRS